MKKEMIGRNIMPGEIGIWEVTDIYMVSELLNLEGVASGKSDG